MPPRPLCVAAPKTSEARLPGVVIVISHSISQRKAAMPPRSLYGDLVDAALRERDQSEGALSNGETLARLVRCRHHVVWKQRSTSDRESTTPALADQLAYDVALIKYARSLGIDCDSAGFGSPQDERQRLEQVLASRGIPLE
jgi:hypothetical protein